LAQNLSELDRGGTKLSQGWWWSGGLATPNATPHGGARHVRDILGKEFRLATIVRTAGE
jgi:hypothetical protein